MTPLQIGCAALAEKAKSKSDKIRLLQLADQWRTITEDRDPAKNRQHLLPPFLIS
jgi:hypothetical protein